MKRLFLILIISGLSVYFLSAQDNIRHHYSIQIGTFMNAQLEDFAVLQSLGYIFAEAPKDGLFPVYIGNFDQKEIAEETLQTIQNKGYTQAFVTKRDLDKSDNVYVIQLAIEHENEAIDWQKYFISDDLVAFSEGEQLKIAVGAFANKAIAQERLGSIREKGFKDAFIKSVNKWLLHEVTSFEMGIETNTKAAKTEDIYTKKSSLLAVSHKKEKRAVVLALQTSLQSFNSYTDTPSGLYDDNTAKSYIAFQKNNIEYQKYKHLRSFYLPEYKRPSDHSLLYSGFMKWESTQVLYVFAADLNPSYKIDKAFLEKQQLHAATRTNLYLNPTLLPSDEKSSINSWETYFWQKMDDWATIQPLNNKLYISFQTVFYQANMELEDYFMNKNIPQYEAKYLALKVLRSIMDEHIQ